MRSTKSLKCELFSKTMLVPLTIIVLLHDICRVDSAIIGTSRNHQANNIIGEKDQAGNTTLISDHAKAINNLPSYDPNVSEVNIKRYQSAKLKAPTPLAHDRMKHTPIVYPWTLHDNIPRKSLQLNFMNHNKLADKNLKLEAPKNQKKLFHHFNIDDFIQKRKELKEKWQARHNKLSHMSPLGLIHKNEDLLESRIKYPKTVQMAKKQIAALDSKIETVTNKENIVSKPSHSTPQGPLLKSKHHLESTSKIPDKLHVSKKQTTALNSRIQTVTSKEDLVNAKIHSHKPPHGLVHKNDDLVESTPKFPQTFHVPKKHTTAVNAQSKNVSHKDNILYSNSENAKRNIGHVYEQVTPRTRRILQHKEEKALSSEVDTEREYSLKTKHRFSAKLPSTSTSPTPPPTSGITESIQSEVVRKQDQFIDAERKITPQDLTSEINDAKQTTESHFNPANYIIYGPYIPMMPAMYWPKGTSTESISTTSSKLRESSSIASSPIVGAKEFHDEDHPTNPQEPKTSQANNTKMEVDSELKTEIAEIAGPESRMEQDAKLRYVPERITTEPPTSSIDDVVSVKIDASKDREESSTTRINSSCFPKNLTDREKALFKKPSFNYGKALMHMSEPIEAHHADNEFTVKLAHDENMPIKKSELYDKLSGKEVAQESVVENSSQISTENGKGEKEKASPPESNAMKISEEPEANQDWREHLRKAVKARLRKLRRDSSDQ